MSKQAVKNPKNLDPELSRKQEGKEKKTAEQRELNISK